MYAQWGAMSFRVTPKMIEQISNLSTSISVKTENEDDANGNSIKIVRGREPQGISFDIQYLRAAGSDPLRKFEQWDNLVGETNTLYIAGKRFGPANLMLEKADLSDVKMNDQGAFLSAKISLSFAEYTASSQKSGAGRNSGEKLSSIVSSKRSALKATPTAQLKAKKRL